MGALKSIPGATEALTQYAAGDTLAAHRLVPLVYDELHSLAEAWMSRERDDHTLQPTALVHEAYLRLIDQSRVSWNDRSHFVAIASEVIRRVLVDHARKRGAAKRGGALKRISLDGVDQRAHEEGVDLIALDEAIEELGRLHERQRRIVEMRFFGGMTIEETAENLGISPATVKVEWAMARAWLRGRLE